MRVSPSRLSRRSTDLSLASHSPIETRVVQRCRRCSHVKIELGHPRPCACTVSPRQARANLFAELSATLLVIACHSLRVRGESWVQRSLCEPGDRRCVERRPRTGLRCANVPCTSRRRSSNAGGALPEQSVSILLLFGGQRAEIVGNDMLRVLSKTARRTCSFGGSAARSSVPVQFSFPRNGLSDISKDKDDRQCVPHRLVQCRALVDLASDRDVSGILVVVGGPR